MKNIVMLVSGTTIARFIPMLAIPFLSRLYHPRDFALLELFSVMTTFLNAISSGTYEYAIILPKEDSKARALRAGAMSIAAAFGILLFIILSFFGRQVAEYAKNPLAATFVFIIPIMIVIDTGMHAYVQWAIRREYFGVISIASLVNNLSSTVLELGFCVLGLGGLGLVIGSSLGNVLCLAYYIIAIRLKEARDGYARAPAPRVREIASVLKEYLSFPKYKMLGEFLNKGVAMLPTMVFTKVFPPEIVGYYGLSKKVLGLTVTVVSHNIGSAFGGRAAKEFSENGECASTYKKTLALLTALAVPGFALIFLVGPPLFPKILGHEWLNIGTVLRILVPQYMLAFIANPLARMFTISNRLRSGFLWQLALFLLSGTTLALGALLLEPYSAMLAFSLGYCGMYILSMVVTYSYARKKR